MKLKKKLKPKVEEQKVLPFSINYSGSYNKKYPNFPYQPQMKHKEIIDSVEKLEDLVEKMRYIPAFAYDTETNTLEVRSNNKDFRCADITISWGENNNYDIVLGHIRDEDVDRNIDLDIAIDLLKPIFEREDVLIIGHNLKFDMHVLRRLGITIKTEYLFDTMLASWICDENTPNGLKENSMHYMGVSQTHFNEATDSILNDVKKRYGYKANAKVNDFGLVLVDDGCDYCIGDAFYTWCLAIGFMQEIEDEKMDVIYYKKSIPFLKVLLEMEERGTSVDIDRLNQMGEDMQRDLDNLQYEIYEYAGVEFDIGSPTQKSLLLFGIDDYTDPFPVYVEKYKKKNAKRLASSKKGFVLEEVKAKYEEKQNDFNRNKILNHCFGFKPNSFTDSGKPSTDSDAIWRISNKNYREKRKQQGALMCESLLRYSKLSKLKTAFVDGIIEKLYDDNKAHPSFNQIGTDSGRLSCSSPNLQQLPKASDTDVYQIRSVFIGSNYYKSDSGRMFESLEDAQMCGYREEDLEEKRKKIIAIDYHNLEMVCLTHFSHDKNLSEMFANDDDAHGSTAVNMFNLDCTPVECKKKYPHLRQAAKTINFLLMYGGGATLLYENLKADHESPLDLGDEQYLKQYNCRNGREVAQKFIDKYFESYSGVAQFIREQKKFAHKNKYVYTVLGRKRRLPDINSSDGEKMSYSERLSVNSAIQGTAGDITISAQLRVASEDLVGKYLCHMLIQVHDELVFECPEEYCDLVIPIIQNCMNHPFGDKKEQQINYLRADCDGYFDNYQEAK